MISNGFLTLTSVQPSWMDLVKECISYDVYHLPFYHALSHSSGEGEPLLFYYRESDYLICLPILLRQINPIEGFDGIGHDYKDATSVYGYAGPIVSKLEIPSVVINRFLSTLRSELLGLKVVSLFTRMHPLIQNSKIIESLGILKLEGNTISIDLTLPSHLQYAQYRRNHREGIKKLRDSGVVGREMDGEDDRKNFIEIYNQAMKRFNAPSSYFFPSSWYDQFLKTKETVTKLFICELDGNTICGGLVALCHGIVELHLTAVANQFVGLSPLKYLIEYTRLWALEQNASVLHLGGGVGAKSDSLYNFKSGFSKRNHLFHTWRWILDESIYEKLIQLKNQNNTDIHQSYMDDYFPKYRAPMIGESSDTKTMILAKQ